MSAFDLRSIGEAFDLSGVFVDAIPYGNGHINDTFSATYQKSAQAPHRYIHQRINHYVFKEPPLLMENIARTTQHAATVLAHRGVDDIGRRVLTTLPTKTGDSYHQDEKGNFWRTYLFIENAGTFDRAETPNQAFEAARAFGEFQMLLSDLPGKRLHETIPLFHHTRSRFDALRQMVKENPEGRLNVAREEVEFALQRENLVDVLLNQLRQGILPERVTHNDTKLNNVMFDNVTGKAICVIDLDTVMPGLALYDFGDMVRSVTNSSFEDEKDLSKVFMQMPMFEALARGYVEATGAFLTEAEKEHLAFSGKLITFEIGMRFLTDFLAGDRYFKTKRPGHNLDRCRSQFKLVESIEKQEDTMRKFVNKL